MEKKKKAKGIFKLARLFIYLFGSIGVHSTIGAMLPAFFCFSYFSSRFARG
jgi:hypothetical protein